MIRLAVSITTLLIFLMSSLGAQEALKRNKLYLKGVTKGRTPIYASASTSSSKVGTQEEFGFVFLFQPPGGSGLKKNGFYRVGMTPDEATGWIKEDELVEWDNRICAHFTPLVGRQPALVWDGDDIEKVVRGSIKSYDSNGGAPHSSALAQEPGDLSKNRYSMLLPVMEQKRIVTGGKVKRAFKVGYLTGGKQQAPAVTSTTIRQGPAALLEIMFVLDATASMQPYIEGAKEVIEKVARRIRESREQGVKIGLTCYRDYIQDQPSMEYITKKIAPLSPQISATLNSMGSVQEATVGSEGYPEAGFDGMYAAITETKWDKVKSALRVIIFIGDASSHPAGDPKNPLGYSLNQIVNVSSTNRVRVVALKIKSESQRDNPRHRAQMQKLATGKNASDVGYYAEIDLGPNQTQEYIDQLAASIEVEVGRMGTLAQVVNTGHVPANLSPTEKAIILNNLKVTSGNSSPRKFDEGWIREFNDDNRPLVKPYVYMSKDDLDLALSYLKVTLQGVTDPKRVILNTIREVLETETGDKIEAGQKLEEHYEKRFGLPATSNVLKFTIDEIERWGEQRRKDLQKQIESKYKLLESHKNDQNNWHTIKGSQLQYTFVPLSFFP